MPKFKRFNMKAVLANPDLRRKLVVEGTQATQAREDIEVSKGDAEDSYYVVTESEKATFLDLYRMSKTGDIDERHVCFTSCIRGGGQDVSYSLDLSSFGIIDGTPLSFKRLEVISPIFKQNIPLFPYFGETKIGHQTFNDERFVRRWWEPETSNLGTSRKWAPFAKGGSFSRFYSDVYLAVRWDCHAHESYKNRRSNFNVLLTSSASEYLHREGLTWPRRTNKGFNIRRMPAGCVFGDKGPVLFVSKNTNLWFMSSILNSALAEYTMGSFTSYSWESGIVQKMPIPSFPKQDNLATKAELIHDAKAAWDEGNEISTRFSKPWLLQECWTGGASTLTEALDAVLDAEEAEDTRIQQTYAELNTAVYKLYGITDKNRARIEEALGQRPPELIWPQMEGKTREQKRLEHVYRLLSYALQQVLAADEDGIIPFQAVAGETPLIDRLLRQLASYFTGEDSSRLEIAIANELKAKVKGAKKAETIADWLNNQFFAWHAALYQNRPIRWHLASSQDGKRTPAFAALVDYHKFDRNRMAKLRSTYVKEFLATQRKNTALASKEGREADRLELEDQVEEVSLFDQQLARIEEGHHEGPEGGDRDYRILTPWKAPTERPQGWDPDIGDGVKVNITPLIRANLLRTNGNLGMKEAEED